MSSAHSASVVVGPLAAVLVPLVALVALHLGRALSVSPRSAQGWAAARSLRLSPRLEHELLAHLRRLRWARVWCTALVGAVAVVLVQLSLPPISFVGLPLLVSVLVVEALAPQPRRGRIRVASLERRARSYFAPRRALAAARALVGLALLLAALGLTPLGTTGFRRTGVPHLVVLVMGAIALEHGLARLTRRGLPDRTDDAALDCALRVADARALTATALVFGAAGLLFTVGAVPWGQGTVARQLMALVSGPATTGLLVWVVLLLRPLPSWRPE